MWRWSGSRRRPAPSRTGEAVAAVRAALTRPHTPTGDPDAQARICAGMTPARTSGLRAHMVERTRFFDDQVLAALRRDVDQIVVLGAGYDDRALRFRSPGVRFFEVDQPATQADKRRRLRRAHLDRTGLTLVAADFRVDDVAARLARAGHDPHRPTLFVAEGLLVYLDQPATVTLLAALRSRAAAGSVLVASLALHPEGLDSAAVVARANAGRHNGTAEPWRTILPATGQIALLGRAGWTVAESSAGVGSSGRADRSLLAVAEPAPPPTT